MTHDPIQFSVIIPLYNKERHIRRALMSVLKQTCPDFEVIIVDDGSTDKGVKQIPDLRIDDRVRIITQDNRGVCAARNTGIRAAQYPYIAFLDADDSWETNFLEEIHNLIRDYPDCGLYATAFQRRFSDGRIQRYRYAGIPFAHDGQSGIIPNFFYALAYGQDPVTASSVCVPRQILDQCGVFPDGVGQLQEDVDLWLRIACRYPVAFSGTICANYHADADNRACLTLRLTSAIHPLEHTIQELTRTNHCSVQNQIYLNEYLALIYWTNAVRCLAHQDSRLARQLLRKVHTRRPGLILKRVVTLIVSLFPASARHRILERLLPEHLKEMGRTAAS